MSYKRLTKRIEGRVAIPRADGLYVVLETKKKDDVFFVMLDGVIKRLAELEDKLESGEPVKFPCKIGDKIYIVPSETIFKINIVNRHSELNHIYVQTVEELRYTKDGFSVLTDTGRQVGSLQIEEFFGKIWFLTKEAAEARLIELQEGKK